MFRRRRREPMPSEDPDLEDLRRADFEYHSNCIDIQEPDVPVEDLPLNELAEAARHVARAADKLLSRHHDDEAGS